MSGPKQSPLQRSIGDVTGIIAMVVTFFSLPVMWLKTTDTMQEMAAIYFPDPAFVASVSLIWLVLLGVLIFSGVRAVLSGILSAFGLALILFISRGKD